MFKKSVISASILVGIVVVALASTGGGKKKSTAPNPAFTPLRSAGVFTIKTKPDYSGSFMLRSVGQRNSVVYRSVITYQRGNAIYVVPSQYRMSSQPKLSFSSSTSRSNLNMLDLKLRLCK